MNNDVIEYVSFSQLDVRDPFFSTLIEDYEGFEGWFEKKSKQGEKAYILKEDKLRGFLYLKEEEEADSTINPPFEEKRRLKIGTFKIESRGTVLGERFVGLVLKKMIEEGYLECYVTVFEKQKRLIKLFEKFGFTSWGLNKNGELVYTKSFEKYDDIHKDFPRIKTQENNKYLLSIWPKFHTKLFPNSKLQTEKNHRVEDLAFTNTTEKVYLASMTGMEKIQSGDLLVIYRTADYKKSAEWSSVATSVCTVIERRNIREFNSVEDFIEYCGKGTIFSEGELINFWNTRRYPHIVKMLYNISLPKRIVRHNLIQQGIMNREDYAGFMQLEDTQFDKIIELGEVNESFIID